MGNGAGKKKINGVAPQVLKPLPEEEVTGQNRSPIQSPPLPAVPSRRPSGRDPSPSSTSRGSVKQSSTNLANARKLSSNTLQDNDNVSLPPVDNRNSKPASRLSIQTSSAIVPALLTNRSRSGSQSSSASSKHTHRKGSPSIHDHSGRCSKCPHCRRLDNLNIVTSPKPKWLTKNPGTDQVRINMDEYDIEAVKDKIISKNHHLLGSYDYQPYLTIDPLEGDYDQTKENYYTQPFVAKLDPRVTPLRTPFPDYVFLQRREQRLNKPYSLPLFDN